MRRHLTFIVLVLIAAACASAETTGDAAAHDTYFADAAAITTTYETVALDHFNEYLTALNGATAVTGDAVFVDANKALFSGLAAEFGVTVNALVGLTPPPAAEDAHDEWIAAGQALNDVFQGADAELSGLDEAEAVNDVVSVLPLRELQAAYREACHKVATLAAQSDDPTAMIACESPRDGA